MPIGMLYENFVNQGQQLRSTDEAIALALLEQGQRDWQVPVLGAIGDLSVPGLADAYDRTEIADAYNIMITNKEGSVGDAMSAKLQSDYLASQERAYRLRSVGPVRCAMHAAARRYAHGLPDGAFGRVEGYAQDLILAGAAGYVVPENGGNIFAGG
jgi:hypothetical protein